METTVRGPSDGSPVRATPVVGTADLRRAIDDDELFLLFQPLIDLHADRVAGVEALLRWRSPDGVVIGPDDFIPVAEQTGLIVPMGALVLELACRQWVAWQVEDDGRIPVVAVNVSVLQLGAPGFVRTVADVLARTGAAASGLCLEITESALGSDGGRLVAELHELRALGVRISVDDFGTGFSSLARLRDFPVDELKIDRSFIRDMHLHERDRAIVRSIVALGSALRLTVVAEGVETSEQLAILRSLGCDAAQGHLFSVPAPAADVQRCVRDRWSPQRGLGRASGGDRAPLDEATDAEVGFLLALAVSVVASADLDSALETILPDVCTRLGWDCAQAWTPEGDDLRCAPQWHGEGRRLAAFRAASTGLRFATGSGLPGRARAQRRAIWSDLSTDVDFTRRRAAGDAGLRTGVAVPVIADGEVAAVVEFFARRTPQESSRTIGILSSVVTHLGSFLERKQAQRSLEGVRSQWDGVIEATADAVVVADDHGAIVEWNSAAERMFGWRRAEVIDGPLSIIVPPAHRERHAAGYAQSVAGRRLSGQRLELEALHRDGSTFPIELTLSALPEGHAAAFVGLVRDLSEGRATELALARHATQLEDLIRMLQALVEPDATSPSTMSAVISGIAALCAADGAYIELRSGTELVHAGAAGIASPLLRTRSLERSLSATCARTGAVQRCEDTEADDRVDPDAFRTTGIRSMVVVPLTHQNDLHGVLTVVSSATGCIAEDDLAVLVLVAGFLGATVAQAQAADDLATTVRSRELLMRSAIAVNRAATLAEAVSECLELVARCAGAVVGHVLLAAETGPEALVSSGMLWCADGFDVSALASETATRRFAARDGVPGAALAGRRPVWVEDVTAADGRRVETARRSGVHACMAFPVLVGERVVAVIELGLPEPRACDEHLLQLAGQLGELLGRAFERDEAAVALRAGEERFRMMFEHAPIAMCLTSFSGATKGQLMDANQALCDLLGLPRDELVGRTFSSITSPGSDLDAARDVYEAVDAGATVLDLHKSYLHVGGDPVPCHVVATIVRDAAGLPLYSVTHIRDIRAELAERETLSHQALHDPLTGLANRRMLDARLGPIVAAARRGGRSTSVFVVDLDGLKATNDRFGHDAGDAAIIAAGAALVRCLRPEDLVVRIGGDEFVALVAGSPVAPWRTARRLERAVADSSPGSPDRGISASSGWAVDDGVVVPDLLIGRADARMYERKRAKARVAAR